MADDASITDLQHQFDLGFNSALDPASEHVLESGGPALTSVKSFWLHRLCRVCGHSFRIGDSVLMQGDRRVAHNSSTLPCASQQQTVAGTEAGGTVGAFYEGLLEEWPPPRDLQVRRLVTGDPLLAPPTQGFQRRKCFVCSHTFRENDLVAVCPCSPRAPLCQIAVHRDPVRGLTCFDEWNPGGSQRTTCPVTFRSLRPGSSQ